MEIPDLKSTSEFIRFTNALMSESEELGALHAKGFIDDESREEIASLFTRTLSIISRAYKPIEYSPSEMNESFGFFQINDYNRFIDVINLLEQKISFVNDQNAYFTKLQNIWGDFKYISNSSIVYTTLNLLLDLCIAIEDDLIVIDIIVPAQIAKSEHEIILKDILKYDRQGLDLKSKISL
uniref:Uncharacterized protein n=1 Tax=Acrobeloides nanus TaxID=290746 RepID=A0A914CD51_9BILA